MVANLSMASTVDSSPTVYIKSCWGPRAGFIYVYCVFAGLVGVRGGARTGYFIPGRDGIGGLDLAGNSSAVAVAVAVVAAAVRGRDSDTCYTCAIVSYDYNSKLRLQ